MSDQDILRGTCHANTNFGWISTTVPTRLRFVISTRCSELTLEIFLSHCKLDDFWPTHCDSVLCLLFIADLRSCRTRDTELNSSHSD